MVSYNPNIIMKKAEKKRVISKSDASKKELQQVASSKPEVIESIHWEAPEFAYNPKDVSWYWMSLIIAIVLIALAAWQNNFLFIIFVGVGWFLIVSLARRMPAIWEFGLDDSGVHLHRHNAKGDLGKFYHWRELEGFAIREGGDGYHELVLRSKSRLSTFIKINFPDEKEKEINRICSRFLAKKDYEESFADNLSKLIKF